MLFLRCQVEAFAYKKWGGPEELDAEYTRRTAEKRNKKGKKFEQGLKDLRRKTREGVYQRRQDEVHKHEYATAEVDGEGRSIERCIGCGFEVEVELL